MTENEPKTRKRRKETAEGDDNTEVVKPRKEKRKREDTEDSGVTKPRKEKRKREDTVDGAEDSGVTKPKKEKRRRKDPADGAEDAAIQVEEPPKKKHKNKTGFPDPGEDSESLSDQARKALSYAFLQFRKRSKWKFSKPRQNWLIRNVWSDQIPDMYLPLTIQYLSNVKGGVRETLIKDCRSILSGSSPEKVSSTETETASQVQPVGEPDQRKHVRARALLDALEAVEAEPES
ncbi:hypothetical protein DFH08DRAFT_1070782 [Mycena albidolilacea]|uniref:WKF domain-containing protein n=1 Tax=Mycena albidolilacea TaxID=1033008 RepID=A0AAD7ATW1_9AGAR|nr:hypothetical protein DFH08DRAFT_1070782 [Mycena albidolilacea]